MTNAGEELKHMVNQPDMGAFGRLLGMEVVAWSEGKATVLLPVRADFLNRSRILHGGILTTLIDTAGGYAGTFCAVPGHVRRALTLSMTTQFIGQASSGTIRAEAVRRGGGRKIFFADVDVSRDDGEPIAFGSGTYRFRSGHDDPAGIPLERER